MPRHPRMFQGVLNMRFLRLKEVMTKTGLTRSSIYRAMTQEQFPSSIKITPRCVVWDIDDIENWMGSCKRHS